MRFGVKKLLATVLSAALVAGQMFTLPVYAADYAFVSDVSEIFSYIDASDIDLIDRANDSVMSKVSAVDEFSNADLEDLLTTEFVSKFADADAAKAALVALMTATVAPYYSTSESEMNSNIEDAINTLSQDDKDKVFGSADMESWIEVFILAKKDAKNVNTDEDKLAWALGIKANGSVSETAAPVIESLDRLQVSCMETRLGMAQYSELDAAIAANGWNVQDIVDTARLVANKYDANNLAEFALAKASARSAAVATVDGRTLVYAGNDLENAGNIIEMTPDATRSINFSLVVLNVNVTNLVGYCSTDDSVVAVSRDVASKTITVTPAGGKGTADVILFRDPLAKNDSADKGNWILRFRIVIANTISAPTNFSWGSTGELTWDAVPNADNYTVLVYKDGSTTPIIEENNVTGTTYTPALNDEPGSYTAKVIAYGDIPEEIGGEAETATPYVIVPMLGRVNKPTVNPSYELEWDAVADATKYTIKAYDKNGNLVDTIEDVTGTSYDLKPFFETNTSEYSFTVQAKNETQNGEASEASDPVRYVKTVTFSGYVKMQKSHNGETSVYKDNNAGITVTIMDIPDHPAATTNADGSFTITNLPTGEHTLRFKKGNYDGYLEKRVKISIDNDNIVSYKLTSATPIMNATSVGTLEAPIWLRFGEFSEYSTGVGPADLAALISAMQAGSTVGLEKFDANDDGSIGLPDYTLLIRNYNKNTDNTIDED